MERRGLERGRKKIEKDVQKVLTKNLGCGIISKLSQEKTAYLSGKGGQTSVDV